ncbi:ATP-binding protein [Bacterioplanoides sp. SCSIO 12839]|uniref:ATP-binding protein n=1 Tax=Bacterioplanoides sp. SCSIO 12839 TaxID=2829569 RepID=UPI0021044F44|nr:ATP-binding protein [Bacterioplanoides sp. SCSIO 12839]UTW47126.1 hypothetical protein KFF03_11050 [Bacterioplanoides sp. SCSIO 12839]
MNRVIALFGPGNSGKTSTLRIVHQQLLKMDFDTMEKYHKSHVDIREIFIIDGVKVGLETQGDPYSRLAESLELFKKIGCKIIICASRTRGSTV